MQESGDLQKDVEALERILFRLASLSDERMLPVLQVLLPELLRLFPRDSSVPLAQTLTDKVRLGCCMYRLTS